MTDVVRFAARPDLPLLVVAPSLGTTARSLWSPAAELLADRFDVVGFDLPGHGDEPSGEGPLTMATLAADVGVMVDGVLAERGEPGGAFAFAGDSVGGCLGLQLLLDAPQRLVAAVLVCTAARVGTPEGWRERSAAVAAGGTAALVEATPARWFGEGFADRSPDRAQQLLDSLRHIDDTGYARVCEALAAFDVRDRLGEITAPVLAIAGSHDTVTPESGLAELAAGVRNGRVVVLDGVAHLAPAEAPAAVASLVADHVGCAGRDRLTRAQVREGGFAVRRQVLGDAHVDRAQAATTDLTRDFQDLITRYAWGEVWTRPGLDRRMRSAITLTALVAGGHHDELAMHLRAARTNGLSDAEIGEVLLQTAIYCGVPAANSAFKVAQQVLGIELKDGPA